MTTAATAPISTAHQPQPSHMRWDVVSGYLMTALRLGAWIFVVGAVYHVAGNPAYSILGLVQSTVGILEYAAVGLSPAIIRITAQAISQNREQAGNNSLWPIPAVRTVYANGIAMALLTALLGGIFLAILLPSLKLLMPHFSTAPKDPQSVRALFELLLFVGIATLLRMMSDAPAAILQTRDHIYLDNGLQCLHEIIWAGGTVLGIHLVKLEWQRATGLSLIAGSGTLLIARSIFSHRYGSGIFAKWWRNVQLPVVRELLLFGGMVVAAQMADFLYAPSNNLLIWFALGWDKVGVYTPAVQIDGGMLLVASALAMVLLPRAALVHAEGDSVKVKQYYMRGTLFTTAALLIAAPIVWALSSRLFNLWLHDPKPDTCAILPFVLIHTVIGGSSAVGRSILLAIGKVRAFTISVVIAGIANVLLSFTFVYFLHLGLKGIVFGTIIAVTGRCAIWLPWYVLRVLRIEQITPSSETEINLLRNTTPPPPMD